MRRARRQSRQRRALGAVAMQHVGRRVPDPAGDAVQRVNIGRTELAADGDALQAERQMRRKRGQAPRRRARRRSWNRRSARPDGRAPPGPATRSTTWRNNPPSGARSMCRILSGEASGGTHDPAASTSSRGRGRRTMPGAALSDGRGPPVCHVRILSNPRCRDGKTRELSRTRDVREAAQYPLGESGADGCRALAARPVPVRLPGTRVFNRIGNHNRLLSAPAFSPVDRVA